MDVTADGEAVVALVAAQVEESGRLTGWTRWRSGQERLLRWDASVKRIDELPLPTPPGITAVLEDAFGPNSPGDIRERTFEAVDPRNGQVQSRISAIRLSDTLVITADILEMMASVPSGGNTKFLRPAGED
ncbi:hypothetical protein [Nonomuraea sp. SYSU D8015]|uniref:hypothetical protein n=1 Tax=Nonomuraea sp. SYSU D8015 TaxID=2593644 RepID=UPI0016602AEA|nr:hypothetical protein [Nonomuraea sp. SYSU D8015]